MQLSPHFHAAEFACRDGHTVPEKYFGNLKQLVWERLEPLRLELGRPVVVISGYRTQLWNAIQGGASRSWHLKAGAADVRVAGMSSAELYWVVRRLEEEGDMAGGGVGYYPGRLHLDIGRPRGRYTDHAGNRYFSHELPEDYRAAPLRQWGAR